MTPLDAATGAASPARRAAALTLLMPLAGAAGRREPEALRVRAAAALDEARRAPILLSALAGPAGEAAEPGDELFAAGETATGGEPRRPGGEGDAATLPRCDPLTGTGETADSAAAAAASRRSALGLGGTVTTAELLRGLDNGRRCAGGGRAAWAPASGPGAMACVATGRDVHSHRA